MKQRRFLISTLLVIFSAVFASGSAFASSIRLTQTDELVIALRQAVQKQYRVPAHDVLVLWNDTPLEQSLKKLGVGFAAEISGQEMKNLLNKKVLFLRVLDPQKKYRSTLRAKVKIDAWSTALTLTSSLDKGEILSKGKVKAVRKKLSVLPRRFLKKLAFISEYKALRDLPEGTILTKQMVKQRPIVLKGSQIKVKVINKNLSLVAKGEALESGVRDQMIKVKILNFGSNKIVSVKVTGEGLVTLTVK